MDIQKLSKALVKGRRRNRMVEAVHITMTLNDAILQDIGLNRTQIFAASLAPNNLEQGCTDNGNHTHHKMREVIMKSIATTFTLITFAGSALADNTFPCSKLQLWVTSLPTVVTNHNRLTASKEVSIANIVLRGQSAHEIATRVAQTTSSVKNL